MGSGAWMIISSCLSCGEGVFGCQAQLEADAVCRCGVDTEGWADVVHFCHWACRSCAHAAPHTAHTRVHVRAHACVHAHACTHMHARTCSQTLMHTHTQITHSPPTHAHAHTGTHHMTTLHLHKGTASMHSQQRRAGGAARSSSATPSSAPRASSIPGCWNCTRALRYTRTRNCKNLWKALNLCALNHHPAGAARSSSATPSSAPRASTTQKCWKRTRTTTCTCDASNSSSRCGTLSAPPAYCKRTGCKLAQ